MIRVTIRRSKPSARAPHPEAPVPKPEYEIRLVNARTALGYVRQGRTVSAKATKPNGREVSIQLCGGWPTSAFLTRIWSWAYAQGVLSDNLRFYLKGAADERSL